MTTKTRASKQKGPTHGEGVEHTSTSSPGSGTLSSAAPKYSMTFRDYMDARIRAGEYVDIPWSVWKEIVEQLAADLRRGHARNSSHLQVSLEFLLEAFIYDRQEWSQASTFECPESECDIHGKPLQYGIMRLPHPPFRLP